MNEYPLHWYVYENDVESLRRCLSKLSKNEIDRPDLRNKTALELAIFLNRYECAKVLVENGADCCHITKSGWNLVQESVSTGNADLIRLIMTWRDFQRSSARNTGIPDLLNKLKQAPDFYVEMKWEFTSWIPLISKACPSDVYRIYKSGSNVRIDTTLIGFNGTGWERGNRSYIFQAAAPPTPATNTTTTNATSTPNSATSEDNNNQSSASASSTAANSTLATIIEIDHIKKTYYVDKLAVDSSEDDSFDYYEPSQQAIQNKLLSPNIVTYLDIEKIEFERNKSGFFGWKTEKTEHINGYNCKVYTANNLQLVTKTRVEHLNSERAREFLRELEDEEENGSRQQSNSNLPGFLSNIFQGSQKHIKIEKSNKTLSALEYFQKAVNIDYYLNGSVRAIDETQKMQSFNATLSLCDSYPLLLHEQVSPIVDLMALNNSHFKKLKEFITLQLPSGFPVKIEIPLYRVITAKVTFGNINASDHPVEYVTTVGGTISPNRMRSSKKRDLSIEANLNNQLNRSSGSETSLLSAENTAVEGGACATAAGSARSTCVVDESVFKIPSDYRCINYYADNLASIAPPSSSTGSSTASTRPIPASHYHHIHRPNMTVDEDDILLQLAIQQSLSESQMEGGGGGDDGDEENVTALEALSGNRQGGTQSLSEYQRRLNSLSGSMRAFQEEDIILQRVLAESLLTSSQTGGSGGGDNLPQIQLASLEGGNQSGGTIGAIDELSSGGGGDGGRRVVGRATTTADDEFARVLEMSKREEEERRRREQEEEEELRRVLELSLNEK